MHAILNFRIYVIVIVVFVCSERCLAQDPALPVPTGNVNQLFYLQRTPDDNTVVYQLNYKDGILNNEEPVNAYWIRYAEQGQQISLTTLQWHFAYGLKAKKGTGDSYSLAFLADRDRTMTLRRNAAGRYGVYITLNQKDVLLKKIYLKINGGSFWSPNIEYAEFTGSDAETGAVVSERFSVSSK